MPDLIIQNNDDLYFCIGKLVQAWANIEATLRRGAWFLLNRNATFNVK
jgi:hypothetical protein